MFTVSADAPSQVGEAFDVWRDLSFYQTVAGSLQPSSCCPAALVQAPVFSSAITPVECMICVGRNVPSRTWLTLYQTTRMFDFFVDESNRDERRDGSLLLQAAWQCAT